MYLPTKVWTILYWGSLVLLQLRWQKQMTRDANHLKTDSAVSWKWFWFSIWKWSLSGYRFSKYQTRSPKAWMVGVKKLQAQPQLPNTKKHQHGWIWINTDQYAYTGSPKWTDPDGSRTTRKYPKWPPRKGPQQLWTVQPASSPYGWLNFRCRWTTETPEN